MFFTIPFLTAHGSPPRARGKVYLVQLIKRLHGITPACAGKRGLLGITLMLIEDHPRVRGEKMKLTSA